MLQPRSGSPTATRTRPTDWGRSARVAHGSDVHGRGRLREVNWRWSPIMRETTTSPNKILTRYLTRGINRHHWRRSSVQAVMPLPRRPGAELVDALTSLVHRVSPDELLAGRRRGNYLALCGARFP
jgi:hypothetical protein